MSLYIVRTLTSNFLESSVAVKRRLDFNSVNIDFVKGFRALRALRPLRVVSKNEGKFLIFYLLTQLIL